MGNLYKENEWRSLEKIDRARLLLVVEGLKRGTIVGGNWTSFMNTLKKTGLDYELNTDRYRLDPVIVIAKSEDLVEANRRDLTLPESANGADFHKINGFKCLYDWEF